MSSILRRLIPTTRSAVVSVREFSYGSKKPSLADTKPKKVPYFSIYSNDFVGDDDEKEETLDENETYGWDAENDELYGFDGDMSKVGEDGVPLWKSASDQMIRTVTEKEEIARAERRAYQEALQQCTRVSIIDEDGRSYGTGRRKTSCARVWIQPGHTCDFQVNGKPMADYFSHDYMKEDILRPFVATSQLGYFNVHCTVQGGGISGQAGAIRHGISRALQNYNPNFRPTLKKLGYLTRDPRMVERKKPGQPKARKKFQWVKR